MATRRKPRARPRRRRTPKVAAHAVRVARAPDPLHYVAPLIWEIRAEFDRLIATVMAEVDPILIDGGARRFDAVSVRDLFRLLQTRFNPRAMLSRLFAQIDHEVTEATQRQLPTLSIPAVLSNGARMQDLWVRANTDLIKIEEPIKLEIERVLDDRLKEGVRVEEIREELRERLQIPKRRAELIARDQTLKASGQLQEARQRQAGITRYVWTTSLDERVRPDHALLEGRVFSWDDPPVTNASEVRMGRPERRGHPGSDFQCRCTADPVLDDPDAEAAEGAEPGPP